MSASQQSLRIFISYARSDASAFAEELLAGLEAAGFDPFLDRHDIVPGEDWEMRLGALLQQADTVIYVLTPAFVASERCAWEIAEAQKLSKRIIPVVALDVAEADTPERLRRLNYIYFSTGHPFGPALRQLCTALRTDIGWIREHTRFAELAARWRERPDAEDLLLRGSELAAAQTWLAAWKAPAPEPTANQRAFINESEAAENARNSVERKRLDEMATAQADKERALRRVARANMIWGGLVALLFVGTAAAGFRVNQLREEVARGDLELVAQRALLATSVEELEVEKARGAEREKALAAALASLEQLQSAPEATTRGGAQRQSTDMVRTFERQARIALGWDVDVFFCDGASEQANLARARILTTVLADEQERQLQSGGGTGLSFGVGRVRLRKLSASINARKGYGIDDDIIRAERGELATASELARFVAARGGPTLAQGNSSTPTANYLSVFFCKAAG